MDTDSPVTPLPPAVAEEPILGSAAGTCILQEGWDDPLTNKEIEELFEGD